MTARADSHLTDGELIAMGEAMLDANRAIPEWTPFGRVIIITDWQDHLVA